jgi:hypothetical protein
MHGKTNRASAVHFFTSPFNTRKCTVTGMLRGSLIALAVPPKEEHVLPRQSLYQVVQHISFS